MNKSTILKPTPWKKIDWTKAEEKLKTLQAKLYEAIKNGANQEEIAKIHNHIITLFNGRAIAVRRVTRNSRNQTLGIDGEIWKTDEQKYEAIKVLGTIMNKYEAKPVRWVWIPKSDGTKTRPLGIPTMMDRAVQTLFNFILDVHQKHNANPRSFGFRRGRSPKQAINYAWKLCSGAGKRYVLKIDVKKAYDTVSHDWMLKNIPINNKILKEWLRVGVIENGKFTTNEDGVPQGGPISPTIFNCVMNGVEEEIMQVKRVFPIRFADDIIIFSDTPEKLEKVKEIIKQFLKPRGMLINEEKTRVESIEKGVDFLGYNIKEYSNATKVGLIEKPTKKGILLVKPGKIAITNFKMKVKKAIQDTKSINSFDVIMKLNPIIRGWANYFNAGGGWTETKNKLGYWMWTILKRWV